MDYSRMFVKKNTLDILFSPPLLIALCTAIFVLAFPRPTHAQDWRFEPIVRVGGEYDDNADLDVRTDEEVSLSGLLLDLKAIVTYSSTTTSFSVQPQSLIRKYDESDFDSNDFFLRSDYSYRGQSSDFGFRAFFDQESVRTAERATTDLEIEDPDDLAGDDTGGILDTGDRNKLRLAPRWEYRLSNISSIGANIDYVDVSYDDVFAGILDDYTDSRLNLRYRRKFSSVNTGLLVLTGRQYDAEGASSDTTGYGVMAGFEYALTQKTQLTAMIGFENTDQSGFDYDPEVTGNITLIRNLETIRMFAQYRRSVNASGAGRLSLRDSVNFSFRRRLNEKIGAGIGFRAYQSSGVEGALTFEDRDYVQLESSLRWYLSRSTVIEADYRYTVTDYGDIVGERANANQVNLWFVYQPKTTPRL